jgi:uncharacterized protein YktA (UPF0223 family)
MRTYYDRHLPREKMSVEDAIKSLSKSFNTTRITYDIHVDAEALGVLLEEYKEFKHIVDGWL